LKENGFEIGNFENLAMALETADDLIKQNKEDYKDLVDFSQFPDVIHATNPLCNQYYMVDSSLQGLKSLAQCKVCTSKVCTRTVFTCKLCACAASTLIRDT